MIGGKKEAFRDQPEVWVWHEGALAEAIAHFMFESGARALVQDEDEERPGLFVSKAGFGPSGPAPDLSERLDRFLEGLPGWFGSATQVWAEWRYSPVEDWAEKWKEGLEPLEIGSTLVIKPSWCGYEAEVGRKIIELDPGLAFGTGHHPTTSMCLEALEEFCGDRAVRFQVLDLGTGSGILALAAAALGQKKITAIDLDFEVIPVARANLAANGLTDGVNLICAGSQALRGPFDLILGNLTAGTLIDLADELLRLAAPRARLILSGLLKEQVDEVLDCYNLRGFQSLKIQEKDDWAALVLTGPAEK